MYGGDSGSSSEDSEDEANQDSKDSDTELRVQLHTFQCFNVKRGYFEGDHKKKKGGVLADRTRNRGEIGGGRESR